MMNDELAQPLGKRGGRGLCWKGRSREWMVENNEMCGGGSEREGELSARQQPAICRVPLGVDSGGVFGF